MCCECGFLPQLLCCRDCGAYDGEGFYLDMEDGHLLCEDCAAKAKVTCNLDKGALFAVRYICLTEDKKLFGFPDLGQQRRISLCCGRAVRPGSHGQASEYPQVFLRSLSSWDPDQKQTKD